MVAVRRSSFFQRRTSSASALFRRVHPKTITIAAQLNVSKREASKGATRTIRRFTAQYVRVGCARSGEHNPPFHRRPTQKQSSHEARKGHRSESNCRHGVRYSQPSRRSVSRRPFSRPLETGSLVWLSLRDMFPLPNDGGMMRLFALKTFKRSTS
jgi:hypothetical protein